MRVSLGADGRTSASTSGGGLPHSAAAAAAAAVAGTVGALAAARARPRAAPSTSASSWRGRGAGAVAVARKATAVSTEMQVVGEAGVANLLDGIWTCKVDLGRGVLVTGSMKITGRTGMYDLDGKINTLSDIEVDEDDGRRIVTFRFANKTSGQEGGIFGSGIWELDADGVILVGCWLFDQTPEGQDQVQYTWNAERTACDSGRNLLQKMKWLREDMRKKLEDSEPRGGKRVGTEVWFDVTLSAPLGLAIDDHPTKKSFVGVSIVLDEGSVAVHNMKHIYMEEKEGRMNWVQAGDRLVSVNGRAIESKSKAVEFIAQAEDPSRITLKFARAKRGFMKVILPESGTDLTIPRDSTLMLIAQQAGAKFTCEEEECTGSCWHADDRTGEVYVMCQGQAVEEVPSLIDPDQGLLKLNPWMSATDTPKFDNTEPLILRACPELYKLSKDEARMRGYGTA